MSSILAAQGRVEITLTSTQKLAVSTKGSVQVFRSVGYPNYPTTVTKLSTINNSTSTFGTYTGGATLILENIDAFPVVYDVGTAPVVTDNTDKYYQGDSTTATATATLTVAQVLSGRIEATPAAAVTYTLPTGTLLDAGATLSIGDEFKWSIINLATDVTYIATVAAGTGHTVVGAMAVCANATATGVVHGSTAIFATRKTAANTFITYRC